MMIIGRDLAAAELIVVRRRLDPRPDRQRLRPRRPAGQVPVGLQTGSRIVVPWAGSESLCFGLILGAKLLQIDMAPAGDLV